MGRLDGKVAIITGAGTGLGRGTAILFAKEGATVVLCGRRLEKLQQTVDVCKANGAEALAVKCDLQKMEDMENLISVTMETYGKIDILVNNANAAEQYIPIMDHTQEMWDTVMKTSLEGTWHMMRLCQPIMMKQKFGRIINVSSAAGSQGLKFYGAYAAAKAGIRALTMVAAREWGPEITVNSIAPLNNGELPDATYAKMTEEEKAAGYLPPLGYTGDGEKDVAPGILFLASDDGHYVTGQNINIDGGLFIYF
ncbi:MAG: SDR family oxidoreductase [Lacrimispora sp.]|uniref:SDR family NAD(P)-dependent oxidoreductase n=1 Tax=Lacrimispora sp. TaxID=2719234 RepID=UPI0039E3FFA5